MQIIPLNDQVSVSAQITVDDIDEIVASGAQVLVCNRPDGEDEGQTPYAEIEAAAQAAGLETQLMAFSSYQITNEDRDRLVDLICSNKKLHLYCRSGSRCRRLWRAANKIGCGGHDYHI